MKILRLLLISVVVVFLAGSCGSTRYTSHQQGHPKGCDCPKFK